MKSSISSAVVFGSTVTGLSSGDGGTFTEPHSSMIVCARAGVTDGATGNVSAASSATVVATSARWVTIYSSSTRLSVGSILGLGWPLADGSRNLLCRLGRHAFRELWVEGAGVLPAQHIERLHQFANAVGLRTKHAELDDFFVAEMILEFVIYFVFVDSVLALLEQFGIVQRRFFACRKIFAGAVRS